MQGEAFSEPSFSAWSQTLQKELHCHKLISFINQGRLILITEEPRSWHNTEINFDHKLSHLSSLLLRPIYPSWKSCTVPYEAYVPLSLPPLRWHLNLNWVTSGATHFSLGISHGLCILTNFSFLPRWPFTPGPQLGTRKGRGDITFPLLHCLVAFLRGGRPPPSSAMPISPHHSHQSSITLFNLRQQICENSFQYEFNLHFISRAVNEAITCLYPLPIFYWFIRNKFYFQSC